MQETSMPFVDDFAGKKEKIDKQKPTLEKSAEQLMNIYKKARTKQQINANFGKKIVIELQLGQKPENFLIGEFIDIFKKELMPESTKETMILPFDLNTKTYNIDKFFLADRKIHYLTMISLSKIKKLLSINCKVFYYDLHGIYRKRSLCEYLCSSGKNSRIIEEYDKKIQIRHKEIEYNLTTHFKEIQLKYGFEIKAGYLSAWIEIRHPFINQIKFNQIEYADCHILKKYYAMMDVGYKTRKHLLHKEILIQIVSNMGLIGEEDLEIASTQLSNLGKIMKIQRYLQSKYVFVIQNESLAAKYQNKKSKPIYENKDVKHFIIAKINKEYANRKSANSKANPKRLRQLKDYVNSIKPDPTEYIRLRINLRRRTKNLRTKMVNPRVNINNTRNIERKRRNTERKSKTIKLIKETASCTDLNQKDLDDSFDISQQSQSLVLENDFMVNFFDDPLIKSYIDPKNITANERLINTHQDNLVEMCEERKAEYKKKKDGFTSTSREDKTIRILEYDKRRLKNINDSFYKLIKKHGTDPNENRCLATMNDIFNKIINSTEDKKQIYISKEEQNGLMDIHKTLTNIFSLKKKANDQIEEIDLKEEEELTNKFSEIINKTQSGIIKDIFVTKDEWQALIDIHNTLYRILDDQLIRKLKDDWSLRNTNDLFNNLVNEIDRKNKNNIDSVQIVTNEQGNLVEIFKTLIEAMNKYIIQKKKILGNGVKCDLKKMNARFYQIINKDKLEDGDTKIYSCSVQRQANSILGKEEQFKSKINQADKIIRVQQS